MDAKFSVLILFLVLGLVNGNHRYTKRYCKINDNGYYRYKYCRYGCCTDECCDSDDDGDDDDKHSAHYIAIVIGSIFGVTVLFCILACLIVVLCRSKVTHRGVVIHPSPHEVQHTHANVQYLRSDYALPPYGAYVTSYSSRAIPSAPQYTRTASDQIPMYDEPPPSYSQAQRTKY